MRFVLSMCFLFQICLASASDFIFLKDGVSQVVLVAPDSLKKQAEFFQQEFKKCSGSSIPVQTEGKNAKNVIELVLKPSDYINRSRYTISFPKGNVMRIEGTKLSIRFALNHLLENAGIRYPMPGENGGYYPSLSDFSVPRKNQTKDAGFRLFRNLYAEDPEWQLALNNIPQDSYELLNHGISSLFPLSKYGAMEWKETLWAEVKGIRKKPVEYVWEPCYSSETAVAEAVKNICERLKKHPELHTVAMVHNDGMAQCCTCKKCRTLDGNVSPVPALFQKYPVTFRKNHSESYYTWVNRVAEEVLKQYPDTYFGVAAYTETLFPPSFPLNDRVVVGVCTESFAHTDPLVREFWETLIREWSRKASLISVWEYGYGLNAFTLPRAYYKEQDRLFKFLAETKGVSAFVEGTPSFGEGPKRYLYLRQFYNPNLDFELELKDWCRAAVGEDAAPFLLRYYRFWDQFWRERAPKTRWFQDSKFAHYTALIPDGGYLFALQKGDLAQCREWMEKMLASAEKKGDANQKIRASFLMTEFEFYEATAYMNAAEMIGQNGIEGKKNALEIAGKVPEIVKYSLKRKATAEKILKEFPPVWGGVYAYMRKNYANQFCQENLPEVFSLLIPYLKDQEVNAEFQKALTAPSIPSRWRKSMQQISDIAGGRIRNMVPDGSFELGGKGKWIVSGSVVSERAFDGKSSIKFMMPRDKKGEMVLRVPMSAGKNHLLSCKVYLDADYPPGRVRAYGYILGINHLKVGSNYYIPNRTELIPGKWNTVTTMANPGKNAGFGDVYVIVEGMEKGEHVYVDDVVFVEMDMTQP